MPYARDEPSIIDVWKKQNRMQHSHHSHPCQQIDHRTSRQEHLCRDHNTTALHQAITRFRDNAVEIVRFLGSQGADVNVRGYITVGNIRHLTLSGGRANVTPLHIAVFQGNVEVAKLLVSQGADIDARIGAAWLGARPGESIPSTPLALATFLRPNPPYAASRHFAMFEYLSSLQRAEAIPELLPEAQAEVRSSFITIICLLC